MQKITAFLCLLLASLHIQAQAPQKITFPTPDGLLVTADLYLNDNRNAPVMVLCHQANWSRGEYVETAQRFRSLGYTCLAIDQRSGGAVNEVKNETNKLARELKLDTDYLSAEADIVTAVKYANTRFSKPVVLVGSSYSASLAIKVGRDLDEVSAVIAFSPGEYFGEKLNVRKCLMGLTTKPVFITSSLEESAELKAMCEGMTNPKFLLFAPSNEGMHGSRTLWEANPTAQEYWDALDTFFHLIAQ